MLFNSYEFLLVFLPLALGVCLALGSAGWTRAALAWLVAASLFFHAWWNPTYLPLLLGSIVFNFVVGRGIARTRETRRGKLLLAFGVAANLLLLGTFKYANFVVDNLNAVLESEIVLGRILLPLAISFFTFQQVAYLVRSWRGQERSENLLE